MKKEYVIVSRGNRFYNGYSWSHEYPDAAIFRNLEAAKAVAEQLSAKANASGRGVVTTEVISSYGMDNQVTEYQA